MAYKFSVQESKGCSPNKVMFGREKKSPRDLIIGIPPKIPNPVCHSEYVKWLKNVMADTHEFVHKNLEHTTVKQKEFYDKGLKPRTFSKDDFVWKWYPPTAGIKLGLGEMVPIRL